MAYTFERLTQLLSRLQLPDSRSAAASDEVERILQLRRHLLRRSLICFPFCFAAWMLEQVNPKEYDHGWMGLFALAGGIAFLIWLPALIKGYVLFVKMYRNRRLTQVLLDELFMANLLKAASFAFLILISTQSVFFVHIFRPTFHLMTVPTYAALNFFLGYMIFAAAFLHLDHTDEQRLENRPRRGVSEMRIESVSPAPLP